MLKLVRKKYDEKQKFYIVSKYISTRYKLNTKEIINLQWRKSAE